MSSSINSHLRSVSSNLSVQLAEFEGNEEPCHLSTNLDSKRDELIEFPAKVSIDDENDGSFSIIQPPSGIEPDNCSLVGSYVSCSTSRAFGRSSPLNQLPDLSMSPLTASSYYTMERQYDLDTWRMHNLIAGAKIVRSSSGRMAEELSRMEEDVFSGMTFYPQPVQVERDEAQADDEDVLEIFDLDL